MINYVERHPAKHCVCDTEYGVGPKADAYPEHGVGGGGGGKIRRSLDFGGRVSLAPHGCAQTATPLSQDSDSFF